MAINRDFLEELEGGGVATLEPRDYIVPPPTPLPKKKAGGINHEFVDSLLAGEHEDVTENKAKAVSVEPTAEEIKLNAAVAEEAKHYPDWYKKGKTETSTQNDFESLGQIKSVSELKKWEPTIWERIKHFLYQPVAEPETYEGPLTRGTKLGSYYFDKFLTGAAGGIPEIKRTVEKRYSEDLGFEPTPKEQKIGGMLQFYGGIRTAGKIIVAGVSRIPARQALKTILGAGLTFGLRKADEELIEKIRTGKPVDWQGIHFEAGIGELFGAGEVGIKSLYRWMTGFKQATAGSAAEVRAAARAEVQRAQDIWKKTGDRSAFDAMRAKYMGLSPEIAKKYQPPPPVKEFGKYPLGKPTAKAVIPTVPAPTMPEITPTKPVAAITPTEPTVTARLPSKTEYLKSHPEKGALAIVDHQALVHDALSKGQIPYAGWEKDWPDLAKAWEQHKAIQTIRAKEMLPSGKEPKLIKMPPEASGGIPTPPPGLTKAESEHLGKREQAALRAAQKRGLPVGYKVGIKNMKRELDIIRYHVQDKLKNKDEIRQELTDYVKKNMPLYPRGKMVSRINRVANKKGLNEAIALANRYVEQYQQGQLRKQIKSEIKRGKPKQEKGLLKGKYTAEIQQQLNFISKSIALSHDEPRQKIHENISSYEKGNMTYDDMMTENEKLSLIGVRGMTSEELAHVLDEIQSLKQQGKTIRSVIKEEEDAKFNAIKSRGIEILSGGKGIKEGAVSVPSSELEANKTFVEKLINWQYGWDNLMDKLSKHDKTSKPYESDISKLGDGVHLARAAEYDGIEEQLNKVHNKMKEIFGIKSNRELYKILNQLKQKVDLGSFVNADGVKIQLIFTKEQLIKKYMELQDPTLEATFTGGISEEGKPWGMRWTPEIINAVKGSLPLQEKTWADYHLQFYQEYYDSVNAIYREVYGIDLSHNLFYSPIGRDIEADIPENVLLAQESANYASTVNGSLKTRTRNALPLKFNDADSILVNHLVRMEHFKAWTGVMKDLRRVFGDKEIRTAIRQYHGSHILKTIDGFMNDMARGTVDRAKVVKTVDTLRKNFTKSVLGVKPVIALKQIPSLLAYSTEMPYIDFVEGIADFWNNPLKNYRFLRDNNTILRERWKAGFERDIKFAMKQSWSKRLAKKGNFTDWFMALIRSGDKFATMQGGWAKYKSEIKKGVSQDEAIMAAAKTTGRTQPSFETESLSPIQKGGSFAKLFTMFMNQPNKYFRIIGDNARNFRYGRGTKAKALTNILTAWVILPCLFQFIADAFQFKKKHQLRATIFGPINNILVLGQLFQSMYGWVTGEGFDYEASPVFSTTNDLKVAVTKTTKLAKAAIDPYKDIKVDDVVKAVEYYAKASGKMMGYPVDYAVQVERATRNMLTEEKPEDKKAKTKIPQRFGWRKEPWAEFVFSPYSLKEEDTFGTWLKQADEKELRKYIRDYTYQKRTKRNSKWYPRGTPHVGYENKINAAKKELKSR